MMSPIEDPHEEEILEPETEVAEERLIEDAAPEEGEGDAPEVVGEIEADVVNITQGGAQTVKADKVIVEQGGIGQAEARFIDVEDGGIGIAQGENVTVTDGGIGVVAADTVKMSDAVAVLVAANDIEGEDVTVIIDVRAAVVFALIFGAITSIFKFLTRRRG